MRPQRIIRAVDEDGCPVVRVELTNFRGVFAIVEAADFDRLVELGTSTHWLLNRNSANATYVKTYKPAVAGSMAQVAREIVGAGRGGVVRYANGDRLDLRRRNLVVADGYAPGQRPAAGDLADSPPTIAITTPTPTPA